MTDNRAPARSRRPRFVSLRWRFLFPLTLVVLVVAMPGAYGLAASLSSGFLIAEENVLLQNSQAIAARADELYQRQRAEALRIAFTIGVPEAIRARQAESLHAMLEGLAAAANLDSAIVTDSQGVEIAGLLRVRTPDFTDYSVSTGTDLRAEPLLQPILSGAAELNSGLLRTADGTLLYTAVPINFDNQRLGVALVGQRLATVIDTVQASAVAAVTFYGSSGAVEATTFPPDPAALTGLALDSVVLNQVLTARQPVKAAATIGGTPYRTLVMPFVFGDSLPGVIGTALPDNIPFATEIGRQVTALFAAGLAGAAVTMSFIGISLLVARVDRVTVAAQSLAAGRLETRTGMAAGDEIGRLGATLDKVAQVVQAREDKFKTLLRRERRERAYLVAVLSSIPEGVVVQDKDGRVLLMNDTARGLLGTPAMGQQPRLSAFDGLVASLVGTALAPGIYTLGDPRQIDYAGKILHAQAAAIVNSGGQRLGTVLLMRDLTEEVQQSQAREAMLQQLSQDIQQPLAGLAQRSALQSGMVSDFAREISRHAAALQKMIVDMRELTLYNRVSARPMLRPLAVETLMWAVANDWRQIAIAAGLQLQMALDKRGMRVPGDESRLRLAIGNIVDNAIKYTLPGGAISLEIKDEVDGTVHLRIRDNGVGIAPADMEHLFMPFYRGTPTTADGEIIRVPGMGQGLHLARQIIEAHGGRIKVKSRPGVGTAVYVALPLTAGEALPLADTVDSATLLIVPEALDMEAVWRQ